MTPADHRKAVVTRPSPERLEEIRGQCGPRPSRLLSTLESSRDLIAEIDARGAEIEALTKEREALANEVAALRAQLDGANSEVRLLGERQRNHLAERDADIAEREALRSAARAACDDLPQCVGDLDAESKCIAPATHGWVRHLAPSRCHAHRFVLKGSHELTNLRPGIAALAALLEPKR